jgi:phosphoglycolate phosphatase-like HAD superfamily hydrolase
MRHLLFDFDGVIADTFAAAFRVNTALGRRGADGGPLTEAEYRTYFNGNIHARQDHGVIDPDDIVPDDDPFMVRFGPEVLRSEPFPGVIDALRRLHVAASAEGRKFAIVSSTINGPIERYLELHGLAPLFDRVYGASVHKSKVVKMEMAMTDLGAKPEECVFVTDTLGDIREAAHLGLPAIAVSWGYQPAETLAEGSPLAIIASAAELERVALALA